jgi:cytochrome P450
MTETISETGCPHFPFSAGRPLELEPEYAQFRRDKPVARVELPYGGPAWLLTGMREVRSFLGDPRFSRKATVGFTPRFVETPVADQGSVLKMDGADHLRTRRLLAKAFTKRTIEGMHPRMTEIVNDVIDGVLAEEPPVDLVVRFAAVLPSRFICLLLGVPYEDWDLLHTYIRSVVNFNQGAAPMEELVAAWTSLSTYFLQMSAARRQAPGDGLVSALTSVRDGEDGFSDQEVMLNAVSLFVAGYDPAVCELVNMICALMRYPDQMKWLRENLEAVPTAVEELLRFIPMTATGVQPAVATEDVEIGGVTIAAGDTVFASVVSANRDESVFDHAGELDFHRGPELNQHVAFGFGPHHCVGASLARVEMQIVLRAVLERMPNIRLAVPEGELPLRKSVVLRGFDELPVLW